MSPEATYVAESLATIAVFGGALFVATWGLRRLTSGRTRGPLEVIARTPLDGRRTVYLVRVGAKVLIVGGTDGALTRLGVTTLEELGEGAPRGQPERTAVTEPATAHAAAHGDGRVPRLSFRAALARSSSTDPTGARTIDDQERAG